jgi:hypothetical protein
MLNMENLNIGFFCDNRRLDLDFFNKGISKAQIEE